MSLNHNVNNHELIQTGVLINGEFLSEKRESFKVHNPANNQILAEMRSVNSADLELAITSSMSAQKVWAKESAKKRSRVLEKLHDLILINQDDLARMITLEQGKVLAESYTEITYAANYFKWYAEEAKRIYGQIIAANNPKHRSMTNYEPVGVCAAITPWNFPSAMLARKLAPALASGSSMIAKPASLTPLSANALGYLALEAGLPKGLFNIVHGNSAQIGESLTHDVRIRKLSFTGSTEVGVWLYQNSANSMKKLSLELGGNAPFIVCRDAVLDDAVDGIMQAKFRNSGQTCVCANRILVHKNLTNELIKRLLQKISELKLGNGLEADVGLGPLVNRAAVHHLNSLIRDALNNNAKLLYGGGVDETLGELYFKPTLIQCEHSNLRLFKEEIFGPILAVYSFNDDLEAIDLANDTAYGLASYVYTQNLSNAHFYSENLAYGMVGINTGLISAENVPFGGIKMSGLGREGGKEGILEYLNQKYVCMSV